MTLRLELTGGIVLTHCVTRNDVGEDVHSFEIEVTDAEGHTRTHYLDEGEQATITSPEPDMEPWDR